MVGWATISKIKTCIMRRRHAPRNRYAVSCRPSPWPIRESIMSRRPCMAEGVEPKICKVCGHQMEEITALPTQPLQPPHRWQCLCGNWCAVYDRSDEGEV